MDETRLAALRDGDADAFEEFLSEYERRVFGYLTRLTGSRDDAADLAQDTFAKVYLNRGKIKPEGNFASWVFTIATRTAYDWLRRKKGKYFEPLPAEDETTPQALTYNLKETILDVEAALEVIEPAYRAALLLFYKEGLPYEECAGILGIPVNTFKTHLRRGKAAMRRALGENYEYN